MKNRKLWVSVLAGIMALLMLITLVAGILPVAAHAKSDQQIVSENPQIIAQLKEEKKKLQAEMAALEEKISENNSELGKLVDQKNKIDQEIGLLNQQMVNINEQIIVYGALIADKQDELDVAQARLKELNEKNKERIRAMEEDGNLSYWSVLFKANSFADLLDRLNMMEEIAAADQRRLKEMRDAAQAVAEAQAALETEKTALEQTRSELIGMQEALEEKRAEADVLLAELNTKKEELDALMSDAEADEEDLIASIAAKEKEYNAAQDRIEAANRPNTPNFGSGVTPPANVVDGVKWVVPCSYVYLSSPYGWRVHPVYGDWRFHSGVDLAAYGGNPIYATRAGTVTTATYNSSAGYYVTVNHGDGFSSSYLHMTHYIVSPGQKVAAGQVIGYVGSTGTSTGNHLHFTLYYNGNTINPANYINFY